MAIIKVCQSGSIYPVKLSMKLEVGFEVYRSSWAPGVGAPALRKRAE